MSTRLKKPSLTKQALITGLLIAFQIYLGHSLLNGQFGLQGQKLLIEEIKELETTQTLLDLEVVDYKHKISLFDSQRLDPDLLEEIARAELSMAKPDEIVLLRK